MADFFRLTLPDESKLVAFADDVVIVYLQNICVFNKTMVVIKVCMTTLEQLSSRIIVS